MGRSLTLVVLFVFLGLPYTFAPIMARQPEISGYMFGDIYDVSFHDDDPESEVALQGQTGLWFRRIYLTLDFPIDAAWKVRLRTEMNSPGDFRTRSTLDPFEKDAYVQWKNDRNQLTVGLFETPTWAIVEKVWGYRSVEKTFVDLQRVGSSRDIGVAWKGSLDPAKKLGYNVMVANGSGTRSETDKGKKVLLSLFYQPVKDWIVEAYGDFEDRPDDTDRATLQGFVGFTRDNARAGFQYVFQHRDNGAEAGVDLNAISVFGSTRIAERLHGFVRFDKMFDPNPEADRIDYLPFNPGARSNMFLFGLDFQPVENVHFMPNAELVFYEETNGVAPGATFMPRMTFFVTFG